MYTLNKEGEITIKACDYEKKNTVVAHKKANISVPITVKPKVYTQDAITYCDGEPVLLKRACNCENCRKAHCSFVLSQNICIEIPIEFSADAIVKEACIDCNIPENIN